MAPLAAADPAVLEGMREELRLVDVLEDARTDPKALINEIRFFDPSSEEWVEFKMFPPEDWSPPVVRLENDDLYFDRAGAEDWYWQSVFVEWLHDPTLKKYLIYKARQLGITLLACAYALWLMLFRPGAAIVAYSYNEEEAKKLIGATWLMFQALPAVLKQHVEIITPKAGVPSEWMRLGHSNGLISSMQALPATKRHGHGTRVTFGIMDEISYMDYAREIYKAINPAVSRGSAKLAMIFTANGVSNKETGEGNFAHHLYHTRKEKRLRFCFLPWNAEPTRDDVWYEEEAMAMDDMERNQSYPLNEKDGFMLSGALYFDREALDWYGENIQHPLYSGQFVIYGPRKARFIRLRDGITEIYEAPHPEGEYGIGVDTATGKGYDYTSADVIDLSSGAIVAHMHAKIEAPRAAIQLHYLGKWYNKAKIAVERQGGYGDALIYALRDGTKNLPSYSNLYRHREHTKGAKPLADSYGHPMGPTARATVLDLLKSFIRQRLFPYLTAGHMDELGSFVYKDTVPSPRAEDGTNDDRVISLGLAGVLYNELGTRPEKPARRRRQKNTYSPPAGRTEL